MARFMQQSQPHVAAFIHYCFLVCDDPVMVGSNLPLVLSDIESETDSSELVEVSSCDFLLVGPHEPCLAPLWVVLRP
jgi:hypothetical protein